MGNKVDYGMFRDACMRTRLCGCVPFDFSDALITDIFLCYSKGELPMSDEFFAIKVMIKRFEDRCRNFLAGKKITLKYVDEAYKITEFNTVNIEEVGYDVADDGEIEDGIEDGEEDEELPSNELAIAMSKMTAQQSRAYNNLSKELLPYCNSETQMRFLQAQAEAVLIRKKNKKH